MSIFKGNNPYLKIAFRYLAFSAFLVLFNFIYSLFAHGVSSFYMTYAFLIPLIGGTLVSFLLYIFPSPDYTSKNLWRMGLITLVIGFLLHGVFDIYGTEEALVGVFFTVGICLLAGSVFLYILLSVKRKKNQN